MIEIKKTKMSGKALLQLHDGRLIAYKKGQLIVYEHELPAMRISLPMPKWKQYACKIRLLERALHTDVRWAIDISNSEVLFLFQSVIYKVNLKTGAIEKDFSGFRGQPFSITRTDDRLLFGDYGTNDKRETVNIYERKGEKWDVIYAFPAGKVRHIHNIIHSDGSFYILTGDEDNESGIWKTDDNFVTVKPLLLGKQQYRCCQLLLESSNSGCYLTDAPSEPNYLYVFEKDNVFRKNKLPGTCIYGVPFYDGLLFSTTVEAEAHAKNKIDYWLSNKPGKGINENKTHIMLLHNRDIIDIFAFEHDQKPLRLFQYASVHFAIGSNTDVFCTPYSVKNNENAIYRIELVTD